MVRWFRVSGSLTAGGFAEYFRNGTKNTVTYPPRATSAAVTRGPELHRTSVALSFYRFGQ